MVTRGIADSGPTSNRVATPDIAENCPHANVGAFNMALFDRQTTLEMTLAPRNSGDARVRQNASEADGDPPLQTVQVRAERLDDVLNVDELTAPDRGEDRDARG